ncbi:MAG: peptidoglycan DD-metalloendopeptidase family protein [Bacteroidales bacterium]|nr:peptidoglycan DD-metalloendopeptidase family protein [Bacteroidales bacterium]
MKLLKNILAAALVATGILGASAQNPHAAVHSKLIAKQTTPTEKVNLRKQAEFIDFGRDEEMPEIDIYTEGWNSKRVNPFTEAQVPNAAMIDIRGFVMPTKSNRVTSPYGYRARFGRMHKGVDIGIKNNDTIYAAFDGKVRLTNYEAKGYGNYVILRHTNGLETVYGHLNKFLVKPDQVVRAGDPIALGGSTGRSTGPHLHWETRYMGYAINPQAIADIPNRRTHGNTYAFSKSTYTQAGGGRTYTASTAASSYIVRQGDTLNSIARSNGLALRTLLNLNGLKESDAIHPGQTLKLK